MAQFAAAQGRVKLLFNGDGVSSSSSAALEPKDLFFCNNRASARLRRRGLGLLRSPPARLASRSAAGEARRLGAELARSSVGADGLDDYDYDSDAETDDLACFRGLVLDIAYRSLVNLFDFPLIVLSLIAFGLCKIAALNEHCLLSSM